MDEKVSVQATQNKPALIDPGALLRDSWVLLKLKWKGLLLLSLFPYFSLIPLLLIAGILFAVGFGLYAGHNWVGIVVLGAVGILLAIVYLSITFSIGGVAMIYLITERAKNVTVKDALKKGWSILWSYWALSFLMGLVVMGGFFLLIIPGIIFLFWFMFSPYVLVEEGVGGMDALGRSREYVRGHWWGVFGRYLLIVVLTYVGIGVLIGAASLLKQQLIGQILQYIFSFLITPFTTIYFILLYENLRKTHPDTNSIKPQGKGLYILIAVLGFILFFAFTFLIIRLGSQAIQNMQENKVFTPGQKLKRDLPSDVTYHRQ